MMIMLSDNERKILRIIWSLYQNEPFHPSIDQLRRMSQRSESQVRKAIRGLLDQGYITEKGFKVIYGWEL